MWQRRIKAVSKVESKKGAETDLVQGLLSIFRDMGVMINLRRSSLVMVGSNPGFALLGHVYGWGGEGAIEKCSGWPKGGDRAIAEQTKWEHFWVGSRHIFAGKRPAAYWASLLLLVGLMYHFPAQLNKPGPTCFYHINTRALLALALLDSTYKSCLHFLL